VNGPAHRVVAVAAWLAAAPHLAVTHPGHLAAGAVIAGACGHGRLSPDADHPAVAPWLARLVPGGHRGILHHPGVPVVLYWLAGHAGVYRWQVLAVAIAWASHLVADLVCGELPWWPRSGKRGGWCRWGLGLATGGLFERWVATPAAVVVAVWCVVSISVPLAVSYLHT
jgi:membrane-bound metal-dependent hydrolase YbcI (DUF457 family)